MINFYKFPIINFCFHLRVRGDVLSSDFMNFFPHTDLKSKLDECEMFIDGLEKQDGSFAAALAKLHRQVSQR